MEMWQTRLQQAKASILLINELPVGTHHLTKDILYRGFGRSSLRSSCRRDLGVILGFLDGAEL